MKIWHALLLFALSIAGCATELPPVTTPILLMGTVEDLRPTGWATDFCSHGQPVRLSDRRGVQGCLSHGGEFDTAQLRSPMVPGEKAKRGFLKIAFPNHGFQRDYSRTHYVVLQPAPAEFEADTGVKYIATVRDNYDPEKKCFTDIGFGHMDWRHCPDKDFHERNTKRCIPVGEYLAHFARQAQ
jgi:hypothetical protein